MSGAPACASAVAGTVPRPPGTDRTGARSGRFFVGALASRGGRQGQGRADRPQAQDHRGADGGEGRQDQLEGQGEAVRGEPEAHHEAQHREGRDLHVQPDPAVALPVEQERAEERRGEEPRVQPRRAAQEAPARQQEEWGRRQHRQEHARRGEGHEQGGEGEVDRAHGSRLGLSPSGSRGSTLVFAPGPRSV